MTEHSDFEIDRHSTPYTHLDFKNDADEFQFAIVSDNSGGGRAGVLPAGLEMVNRLQPEFVVSLGDLIEGYTVFAAHTHKYFYNERYGRDYITTAMTGAMNLPRHGAIDHIVWVTMTDDGPKISNLLLNGILDKHGPVEGDHTVEFGMYHPPGD